MAANWCVKLALKVTLTKWFSAVLCQLTKAPYGQWYLIGIVKLLA